MWAIIAHAVELSMDLSQSSANLRHLPNQAKVRSTPHPQGRTSRLSLQAVCVHVMFFVKSEG